MENWQAQYCLHFPMLIRISTWACLAGPFPRAAKTKKLPPTTSSFVLNKDNQVAWNTATGRLPTRLDALAAPEIDKPMLRGFVAAAKYGYQVPTAKFYPELFSIAGDNYQAVIAGQKTAEQAAKDAAEATRQTITNKSVIK